MEALTLFFCCVNQSDKGDFVECQCDHLTNFAAQGESDDRAGYSIAFYVICSVCAVSHQMLVLTCNNFSFVQ